MGYTGAVLSRTNEDVSSKIIQMMMESSPNMPLSYGFASPQQVEYSRDLPEFTSIESTTILAHKSIHPKNYPPQPLITKSGAIVFDGFLWDTDEPGSLEAANILDNDCVQGIKKIIQTYTGSYTIASISEQKIVIGRDHIGTYPMYYGENRNIAASATNMKMLWRLGLEPKPVLPGTLTVITEKSVKVEVIRTLSKPKSIKNNEKQLIGRIDSLLVEAAFKTSKRGKHGAVAFSGGIDSVLTAHYLREAGVRTQLICVGVEGSKDFHSAERAASYLDLPLITIEYAEYEVQRDLDKVIRSIEEPNPMKIGVGLPLFWVTENALKHGLIDIYSGNGSDELFAGYKKYLDNYSSGRKVEDQIFTDVKDSWKNNYDRDFKVCQDKGGTLRLPFTYLPLIELGLSIPVNMKLDPEKSPSRKIILRKLATNIGIPDEISNKPKKAAQYSTGISKSIRKIAKKENMNIPEYLNHRFTEVFKTYAHN